MWCTHKTTILCQFGLLSPAYLPVSQSILNHFWWELYQFGFLIPKDYKYALQMDEQNCNSKWYDATKLEMDQINEYKVFQDYGKAQYDPKSRKVSNAPNGCQKIRVHLIFAVKHDGRHKARLVAGGHLTPDPIETIYSGVVSIRSLRLVLGNAYLEAKTKEKL